MLVTFFDVRLARGFQSTDHTIQIPYLSKHITFTIFITLIIINIISLLVMCSCRYWLSSSHFCLHRANEAAVFALAEMLFAAIQSCCSCKYFIFCLGCETCVLVYCFAVVQRFPGGVASNEYNFIKEFFLLQCLPI